MLEDAFYYQMIWHDNSAGALGIAKRCYKVEYYRKEAEWLITAAKIIMALTPQKDFILFYIHFRLTHLYWSAFNNVEKAIENDKATYSLAIKYTHFHKKIWAASLWLGDMLHQVDGRESEAGSHLYIL